MLAGFEDKGAYALCKFALICPENPDDVLIFTGKTEGTRKMINNLSINDTLNILNTYNITLFL